MAEPRASLYTIPLHRSFADALAAGLIRLHGADLLSLASGMILLPNNRAVTAVRDAFVRAAGGAILLPRLVALGDGDLDDAAGGALDRIDDGAPLPPTVPPLRRRFLLAEMIGTHRPQLGVSENLRLADSLAQVIDQLAIEDVPFAELVALDSDGSMADHWESAFSLLRQLGTDWPKKLAELGLIDRTDLRNQLLGRIAARWQARGLPTAFVVAAGITTSAPAVAHLLGVIARADGGAVILPHVDGAMPVDQWEALGPDPRKAMREENAPRSLESHPQFHLKLLLDRMGFHRDEVAQWPDGADAGGYADGPAERVVVTRHLMAPAQYTAEWPTIDKRERRLPGVTAFDCANPAEEALTIALAMRETLETPGRTAALVTPDRVIAARVAGHLARWGIVADDSAGQPLAVTAAGALLLALVEAATSGFAPVELIGLLNHPLVADGEDRRLWVDRVRELDLLLRGPRPAAGLASIRALIMAEDDVNQKLADWWLAVSDRLAILASRIDPRAPMTLAMLLPVVRETLEALAGDAIWARADGRALAGLFAELERHAGDLTGAVRPDEIPAILRLLMKDVSVRPPQGGHPRLFIWGLIEARLQRADRMILAGLNEGQWPQPASPDPWLAPMVRRRLGLPGAERQIGLSAHDFASALGANDVMLTRSMREGTAPTIPSRLRLRIDALLGDDKALMPKSVDYRAIAAAFDSCASPKQVSRPMPAPSVDQRPKRISVTEVDTLLADPFAFYARAGLGLYRLDTLDAEPTAAWRGTAIHDVLEDWLKNKDYRVAAIEQLADDLLAKPGVNPLLRTLWAPRLLAPLRWAAQTIIDGIAEGRVPILTASEERGEIVVDGITLSGKADRIDRLPDNSLAIVDYKSGSGPAKKAVEAKFALQLGLLGAIAEQQGFTKKPEMVSEFAYWRMNRKTGTETFGHIGQPFYKPTANKDYAIHAGNFVEEAYHRLEVVIDTYLNGSAPFTAKLVPEYAYYGDYDQLMRLEEWIGRERDAGGDANDAAVVTAP